jgi:hypothetical protein
MAAEGRYLCEKCGTRFTLEQRFLKHKCKQMKREELLSTPIGQSAWILYQKWMHSNRKTVKNAASFLHSNYFNSFIKFAQFVKQTKIPDVDVYIAIMNDKQVSPTLWTNDLIYSMFLEYFDKTITPARHAEITIDTLFTQAEEAGVDVSEIFDTLTPNEVIQLLRQRRLSPWILLNSPKFSKFFREKTTTEHRITMESIIRPSYWKKKFESKPEIVKQMKVYVNELKL